MKEVKTVETEILQGIASLGWLAVTGGYAMADIAYHARKGKKRRRSRLFRSYYDKRLS